MPNYYNPYNLYPVSYANQMGYSAVPNMMQNQMPVQQSFAPPQASAPQQRGIEWVEGEIGAKAYQIPQGWPANTPIPLWDSTDTVIYLKSVNQMGVPNPMQKLHYTMENQETQTLMSGNQETHTGNGLSGTEQPDMSKFVTKDDLDSLREEIRSLKQSPAMSGTNNSGNQNGSGNGNRGGRNG